MKRFHDESGSAMAFALAFLTLFGLLVAAVLGFSETGLRSARALAGQADELAAATGAVDGAINRLRGDLDAGIEGTDTTCFTPPALNGVSAGVRCEGQSGSGAVSGEDNLPAHSILTLGSGADGEIGLRKTVNASTLNVTGDVFSNSTIDVAGTLAVSGSVDALGDCTGTITASAKQCANNGGGADPADGVDPGYDPAVSSRPTTRTAPSCDSGWLVQFQPGTYTDAVALNDLMRGAGACDNDVFWFPPGVYHFHFTGSTRRWRINDSGLNIVGGTPLGWSTSAPSRPTISVPGGCDTTAAGVQFIFSADSRLDVRSGSVELCPDPNDDKQRIAIYGMTNAAAGDGASTLSPASASSTTYSSATAARVIDGITASYAIPATNPGSSTTLSVSDFGGIPAGSFISAASLRVAHQETPRSRVNTITASVQPASGSPTAISVNPRSSLTTDTFDLLAAGMSQTADATSFTITYTVTADNNRAVTAVLDGFELSLTYSTNGFFPQSGCVTTTPYPSGPACAFVTTSGNNTSFVTQGTVYSPGGAVDLSFPNNETHTNAFRRGIIARKVAINVPGSWAQGIVAFTVPVAVVIHADREVVLTARIAGSDRVRARVTIDDDDGDNPGTRVTIEEWSVL